MIKLIRLFPLIRHKNHLVNSYILTLHIHFLYFRKSLLQIAVSNFKSMIIKENFKIQIDILIHTFYNILLHM